MSVYFCQVTVFSVKEWWACSCETSQSCISGKSISGACISFLNFHGYQWNQYLKHTNSNVSGVSSDIATYHSCTNQACTVWAHKSWALTFVLCELVVKQKHPQLDQMTNTRSTRNSAEIQKLVTVTQINFTQHTTSIFYCLIKGNKCVYLHI